MTLSPWPSLDLVSPGVGSHHAVSMDTDPSNLSHPTSCDSDTKPARIDEAEAHIWLSVAEARPFRNPLDESGVGVRADGQQPNGTRDQERRIARVILPEGVVGRGDIAELRMEGEELCGVPVLEQLLGGIQVRLGLFECSVRD